MVVEANRALWEDPFITILWQPGRKLTGPSGQDLLRALFSGVGFTDASQPTGECTFMPGLPQHRGPLVNEGILV